MLAAGEAVSKAILVIVQALTSLFFEENTRFFNGGI